MRCPKLDVPRGWCIDDPALFSIRQVGQLIAGVKVRHDHLETLRLAPGRWYTIVPEPTGDCGAVVTAFEVES